MPTRSILSHITMLGCLWLFVGCESRIDRSHKSDSSCGCLLDEVSANDTLHLRLASRGCYHAYDEIWKIYRRGDSLWVNFTMYLPDIDQYTKPYVGLFPVEAKEDFADFLNKGIALMPQDACTTIDTFHIRLRSDSIGFIDSDCELAAYRMLKQIVFTLAALEEIFKEKRELKRKYYDALVRED
jgi:hypothetical protein